MRSAEAGGRLEGVFGLVNARWPAMAGQEAPLGWRGLNVNPWDPPYFESLDRENR